MSTSPRKIIEILFPFSLEGRDKDKETPKPPNHGPLKQNLGDD